MAGPPSTIQVGPFTYDMNYDWAGEDRGEVSTWGLCRKMQLKIDIRRDLPHLRKIETQIHEVFHALWDAAGIPHGDVEEEIVHALAIKWMDFIRDNPEMIRWWIRELRP